MGTRESFKRAHERLDVWQDSTHLVEALHGASSRCPSGERFGLTGPTHRSAVSTPAGIAEGAARRSSAEYLRLPSMAGESLAEPATHIDIARRRDVFPYNDDVDELPQRSLARLHASIRSLESRAERARCSASPFPNP